VEHHREPGEHRLHQHTVLPCAALTQCEVAGIPLRGMEGGITQDDHLFFTLANQPLKGGIRDIGGRTIPRHDQPPLIEHQTEFPPDNPAVMRETFAADLLGATAFAHGVDQRDPIRVDHPEHRRSGQEDLRPALMRPAEAQEPGALGEVGKQRTLVAGQPPIERAGAHTFEGMQPPPGDHLTGPEVRLGMLGDGAQLLINLIKQRRDKLCESKEAPCCLSTVGFVPALTRTGQVPFSASGGPTPADNTSFSHSYSPFVVAAYCCPSGF
jgi:hypothetical protein